MTASIYMRPQQEVSNTAATLVNGTTIFTVTGGPIEILALQAVCVTGNNGTASTLQWSHDPTDGAATTISAASASLANAAAGASATFQGTALSTAPTVTANGACLGATRGVVVQAGTITTVVGVGSTTGTWKHYMAFRPLGPGITVTAP